MGMPENFDSSDDQISMESLKTRISMLEAVIENFPGGLLLFDSKNRLVFYNKHQLQLLEYPEEFFDLPNPTLEQIFRMNASRGEYGAGDVEEHVQTRLNLVAQRCAHTFERKRPNGKVLEIRGVPLKEGGFVTSYLDVTERHKSQNLINHMAHHDQLTGLPNRTLMLDRLKIALAGTKRGQSIALHYIDLDKFKPINDQYGHEVGDLVLKKVAAILLRSARETDTVARIGGDEFLIIQSDVDQASNAKILADRVIGNIRTATFAEDLNLQINASVGIAFAPWDSSDSDELMRKADAAMYNSKKLGPGRISFFSQLPEEPEATRPKKTLNHQVLSQSLISDAAS